MYFITASNDYVISNITCLISYYLQLIADETTRIDDETNKHGLILVYIDCRVLRSSLET